MTANSELPAGAVVMLTDFELRAGAEELEPAFAELARYFRAQSGFGWCTLVRGLAEPSRYTGITLWTDGAGYEATTQSPMFFLYVEDLSRVATISADRTAPIAAASSGTPPLDGEQVVAQTVFTLHDDTEPADFEAAFATQAEYMAGQPGFAANTFVRSVRRDRGYANLGWWQDPDSYRAVMGSDQFRRHAGQVAAGADVTGGLYRPVLSFDPVSA